MEAIVTMPDEHLKKQTRKLVEESVKLSELTLKLFWLSVVLGVFSLFRYVIMVFDFYNN
jgi:hypothetical protein